VTRQLRSGQIGDAELAALEKEYSAWHWSAKATKLIQVNDSLVPNCVAIGQLREIGLERGVVTFPAGCWIAYDPKHAHQRIHLILTPGYRERVRVQMKTASPVVPIQQIAAAAGGTQVRHPLPNIMGTTLGIAESVTYWTHKEGDPPSLYQHDFGKEHSKGVKPALCADVAGRFWFAGGSMTCPYAGITG
jgi:hypothetical protein